MSTSLQYNFGPLVMGAAPKDIAHANNYELGPYLTETTQRFIYGTRYITWDGRVYKYSLSGAACYTHRLNAFYNTISSDVNGIDYSLLTYAQSAGDTEITLTNGSTAVAEDYLAGGLVVIVPTEAATDCEVMLRLCVGNTSAVATTGECTIYLEYPLEQAVTASNYGYVMPSSYRNIQYSASVNGLRSFAGIAATYVSASSYNFWCQTYGVCQLAPQASGPGTVAYNRAVWARHDGTLDCYSCDSGTWGTQYVSDQCAGFILDNNADSNGSTNIMLTISV